MGSDSQKSAERREQGLRLQAARKHLGIPNAAEAVRRLRLGGSETTYQHHENGTRGMARAAARYAAAFQVPVEWLLHGANPPDWADDARDIRRLRAIPIISEVQAGRLADPASQISGDHPTVELGGLPPGDYFATRVKGTSMDRISPPGSLILVNRAERDPLPGRRYVFARRGETTYKKWEPDPPRLEPESTDPSNQTIFPKSEEEWTVIGRVRLTLLDDL